MFSISNITAAAGPVLGKVVLGAKKYSPEIALGLGITGNLLAIGMACKAMLEVDKVKAEHQKKFEEYEQKRLSCDPGDYTEEMHKKDLAVLGLRRGMAIGKLFLPAAGMELASIVLILTSYRILSVRNASYVAAYEAISVAFKKYRARVTNELGADKDREFRFGKDVVDAEKALNDETLPWEEKKEVGGDLSEKLDKSDYAKVFSDKTSRLFQNNGEYNYFFLTSQEKFANHLLQSRGYVFLNEVYQSLGMGITYPGNVVGWLKDHGDNYVDFGIHNINNVSAEDARDNKNNGPILLDFNVDGPILNRFPKK